MGDVADMIIEGVICQTCGICIGDAVGYPRSCRSCNHLTPKQVKVACPVCKRRVRGLRDHMRDAHGEKK